MANGRSAEPGAEMTGESPVLAEPEPEPGEARGDSVVVAPAGETEAPASDEAARHERADDELTGPPTAEHPMVFEPLSLLDGRGAAGAGLSNGAPAFAEEEGGGDVGDASAPSPPPAVAGPDAGGSARTRAETVPRPGRRPSVRQRLLPRTVLGLAAMVLAASVGAAFSGAVLFSYYEYRLSKTTDKINALTAGYQKAIDNATANVNAQRNAASAEIAKELAPLRQLQSNGATLAALIKKVAPSMYFVHTLDANGQPSVGSAFVVASDPTRSLLLTSYTTVAAATRRPGPDLFIRQGTQDTIATVWTWDSRYDLALIVLPHGNLPALEPAPPAPPPAVGDTVFAVSGLGTLGASAVQGVTADVSAQGIEHTAPVAPAFQGGPVVDSAGRVVAVASRTYSPLAFASDGVWFSPFLRSACTQVLSCSGGALSSQPPPQRTG